MKTWHFISTIAAVFVAVTGCNALKTVEEDVRRELIAEDQLDDRFPEEDSIITDTVTGLHWRIGPDRDTDWLTASDWVDDLEGDWKMPTPAELQELHNAGVNWNNWGPFDNDGQSVWSDSTSRGGAHGWLYDFCVECGSMVDTGETNQNRGFAVSRAPE